MNYQLLRVLPERETDGDTVVGLREVGDPVAGRHHSRSFVRIRNLVIYKKLN
jgi:hypothetical protein